MHRALPVVVVVGGGGGGGVVVVIVVVVVCCLPGTRMFVLERAPVLLCEWLW